MSFIAQFPSAAAARVLGERAWARLQRPILRNASRRLDAVPPEDAANVVRAVSHCPIYLTRLLAGLRDGPLTDLHRAKYLTTAGSW
ncbi:hypothetical protein Y013_12380 [Rhodococcus pyridinivorans SB3094]|uniref:Uncharacterized protein n=1 Tax=Rhodococcus pyridinivorans SB3094 TaxID=1435356 RepID=V9XQV0_9NOCA|nr:hypothetical protein Y013_12380 [Rhodococcus pyridinivorans SB3094]